MKITPKHVSRFEKHLIEEERSAATVEKYLRDIRGFLRFLGGADASKERVLAYKAQLGGTYAVELSNPNYTFPENATVEYTIWADSYKVVDEIIPESVKTAVAEAVSDAVSEAVEDAVEGLKEELASTLENALKNALESLMGELKNQFAKNFG